MHRPLSTESTGEVQYKEPTPSITESEKLPWPFQYENAEKEWKWKTISPPSNHHNHYHDTVHIPTVDTPTVSSSTTSIFSNDLGPYPTLTSALPPYQPYAYETPPNSHKHFHHQTTHDGRGNEDAPPYFGDILPHRPDNFDVQFNNTEIAVGKEDPRYIHHINKE